VAAVVDPRFETEEYLALARYLNVHIEHVLETHNHADHVSGHGRLVAATGATIHIHRLADPGYDHEPFDDGWELQLGSLTVRAMHTPGHRPEHTAFALIDRARGEEPWAVLTGDLLFVNEVARPDLAVEKAEGARAIFESLHGKLFQLPPETEIWPGHLGGSLCGGPGMDLKTSSTIGFERRHSPMLAETSGDRFVERAIANLPPQPPNFQSIVGINRGALLTEPVEIRPLSPREVDQRCSEGALVVDVRTDLQFDEAHIPGSVCITTLHAGFGTRLAWVASRGQEIILVGRDDEDARLAARLAGAVGIRDLSGFLAGGMTSWRAEEREVAEIERISAVDLPARLDSDPSVQVLDVRERDEVAEGRLPGSLHLPYHDIHDLPREIDAAEPVAVICSSGSRSAVAASLLARYGALRPIHVAEGGVGTIAALGRPLERGS
jgi:glyoxylase-like metal-dependent hydrolase (beta-lactamase superfamily II)/rhodanese-related sulfurtransferase